MNVGRLPFGVLLLLGKLLVQFAEKREQVEQLAGRVERFDDVSGK